MPKSRFVTAEQLKPLIIYLALAFVAVLSIGTMAPSGRPREVLIIGWIVLFPLGAWYVLRSARE